jgi:amidohydrolase
MQLGEAKILVDAKVARLEDTIRSISTFLYDHPELGMEEHRASAYLCRLLDERGFRVEPGLAGMPTAFSAATGTAGPTIAFLAEYDALPAVGHGCGHNLIAATAVGAALALQELALPARIMVMGTPAEETVGGKIAMVEAGCFQEVDLALIAHPGSRTLVGWPSWASHALEISFSGRPAHAGANPQAGINALDALVHTYISMRTLRLHLKDDVRMPGIIVKGGDVANVVPELAVGRFSLRAADCRYLEEVVIPRVLDCARGAALATGASVDFAYYEPLFRDTMQVPTLVRACAAHLEGLGFTPEGPVPGQGGGVTDVGNVSWVVPTLQFMYAMAPPEVAGHTREFAAATMDLPGQQAAGRATRALAYLALEYLLDGRARESIVREFREKTSPVEGRPGAVPAETHIPPSHPAVAAYRFHNGRGQ